MNDFLQCKKPQDNDEIAVIKTNYGDIKIIFFPEQAPKTVENFITHIKNGYYDGIIFHRVMKDFMIQGGDPQGTGMGGESIWGAPFADEFSDKLYNIRGALSMANSGKNTNGSQFFIVQKGPATAKEIEFYRSRGYSISEDAAKLYTEQGGTPWLDKMHTVFGQVFEGLDVVDEIAAVEVSPISKPLKPVVIAKATVELYKNL